MARSEVSDVFLSYRRKNREFALQLDTALKAEGLEVWIDTEDIPPGSEGFGKDIENGILGADAFVAVFSASYFESKYCMSELQYAIDNNKRIIPVIHELIDANLVPDGASHVNWVYFCEFLKEPNEFKTAFPKLLEAIHLNPEYSKLHTEYLRRVNAYLTNERNPSYLLSGDEVSQAEQWLLSETKMPPYPTQAQKEFVYNSRQHENQKRDAQIALERKASRRQRNFILLFFAALIIAMVVVWNLTDQILAETDIQLDEFMRPNIESSADYIIDVETLSALTLAIENGDEAEIEALSELHALNMEVVNEFYPYITSYMVYASDTSSCNHTLVTQGVEPTFAIPCEAGSLNDTYLEAPYDDYDALTYLYGMVDLYDSNGAYAGTLVMEYIDPMARVEGSLNLILGLVAILVIAALGIYVILFAWRRLKAFFKWITKRNAKPVVLDTPPAFRESQHI